MVVKDVATSIRAALPGPGRHASGLSPPTLNPFAIHPPGPLCISKIEKGLTLGAVAGDMELGDNNPPVLKT